MPNGFPEKTPWWEEWLNWLKSPEKSWWPYGGEEEPMAPPAEYPEAIMSPQYYLDRYYAMLLEQVNAGELELSDAQAEIDATAARINAGKYGPGMPYYHDFYNQYMNQQLLEQRYGEAFAPEPTEPFYSENIETVGDYDAIVRRDEQGRIVDVQPVNPDWSYRQPTTTPMGQPAGMTEFQRAQIELGREQLLAQLGGPRDWITRWQMMHMPRRGPETGLGYAGSREEAEKKGLKRWYPTDLREYGGRYVSRQETIAGLSTEEAIQKAHAGIRAKKDVREFGLGRPLTPEEEEQAEIDWFQGQLPPRRVMGGKKEPTTPPAPGWLPQFVPGLTAGEPITQRPIKTPSGQQWGMTPYSVREGLAGYADWAGRRPIEDILSQMEIMRPRTPLGAGVERWRPAQQRA